MVNAKFMRRYITSVILLLMLQLTACVHSLEQNVVIVKSGEPGGIITLGVVGAESVNRPACCSGGALV